MKYFFFLFILKLNTICAQDAFQEFLKLERVQSAQVGFILYNSSNEQMLSSYSKDKLLYPASLQKLITTSAALELLGADFNYETEINFKGNLIQQKFIGQIEVQASGDPSLNLEFLDFIIDILRQKNINSIEGNIIINQEKFSLNTEKSWMIEDVANYYGSPAYGFNFLKNTYSLYFQQQSLGERPILKNTFPMMSDLVFDNQLISKGTRDNAYLIGLPFSKERKIVGSIPPGSKTFSIKGAIDKPGQVFKNMLLKRFEKEGIKFVFEDKYESGSIWFSKKYLSEDLQKLISVCNKRSNNLYAEAFLKTIGLQKYGYGSTFNGLKAIKELYPFKSAQIYDGSGLSRKNLTSSENFFFLLKKQIDQLGFRESLAVSGKPGTLRYFNSEKLEGHIQAKSGSADGILNYAGYMTNEQGEQLIFVFMVNHYTGSKKLLRQSMFKVLESYW